MRTALALNSCEGQARSFFEVVLQPRSVGFGDFAVIEQVHAGGMLVVQVCVEGILPVSVIDGGFVVFVAFIPEGNQLRFRGRMHDADTHEQARKAKQTQQNELGGLGEKFH